MKESKKQKLQTLSLDDFSKLSPAARAQIEKQLGTSAGEFIEVAASIKKDDLKAVKDLSAAIKDPGSVKKDVKDVKEHSLSTALRKNNSLLTESVKLQSRLLKEIQLLNKNTGGSTATREYKKASGLNPGTKSSTRNDEKIIRVENVNPSNDNQKDYTGAGVLLGRDKAPLGRSPWAKTRREEMQAAARATLGRVTGGAVEGLGMRTLGARIGGAAGTSGIAAFAAPIIGALGAGAGFSQFATGPQYEGGNILDNWANKHIPGMRWFNEHIIDNTLNKGSWYSGRSNKDTNKYAQEYQGREIEKLRADEAFRKLQKDPVSGVYNPTMSNVGPGGIPKNVPHDFPGSPGGGDLPSVGGAQPGASPYPGSVSRPGSIPGAGGQSSVGGASNKPTGSFKDVAPFLMERLQKDHNLTKEQAAGVVGSLAAETGGFTQIQELNPRGGGRGGLGWAQWTGERRVAFEKYMRENGLTDPSSKEANYGFLSKEFTTTHKGEIDRLRTARSAEEASHIFTGSTRERQGFLRPGVEHYPQSARWANTAMDSGGKEPITADGQGPVKLGPEQGPTSNTRQAPVTVGGKNGASAVDKMMALEGMKDHTPEGRAAINQFLKTGGHGMDAATTDWCASSVSAALRNAGYQDIPTEKGGNVANSYQRWGRRVDPNSEAINKDDVLVTTRGKGAGQLGGHVSLLTGNKNKRGQYEVIEGDTRNYDPIPGLAGVRGRGDNPYYGHMVKKDWETLTPDMMVRRSLVPPTPNSEAVPDYKKTVPTPSQVTGDPKKAETPSSDVIPQMSVWDKITDTAKDLYNKADIPAKLSGAADMIGSIIPKEPERPAAAITPLPPPRSKDIDKPARGSQNMMMPSKTRVGKGEKESKVKDHPMQPTWIEKLQKSMEPYNGTGTPMGLI